FSCSMCLARENWPEKKRGALVAGRAPVSTAIPDSVEVLGELQIPLARRARLTFERRLAEGRKVELVQVVLLGGEVGRTQRDAPPVTGARPLQGRVEDLVALRPGLRLGGVDLSGRHIGADARADLRLSV